MTQSSGSGSGKNSNLPAAAAWSMTTPAPPILSKTITVAMKKKAAHAYRHLNEIEDRHRQHAAKVVYGEPTAAPGIIPAVWLKPSLVTTLRG